MLWGARSVVGRGPDDPLTVWRARASEVSGFSLDAGHFLAEERPAETLTALHNLPRLNGDPARYCGRWAPR